MQCEEKPSINRSFQSGGGSYYGQNYWPQPGVVGKTNTVEDETKRWRAILVCTTQSLVDVQSRKEERERALVCILIVI